MSHAQDFLAVLDVRDMASKQIPFFTMQYYSYQFCCHFSFHLVDHPAERGSEGDSARTVIFNSAYAIFHYKHSDSFLETFFSDFYG